ncbi:Na/Pi cotransporter family protein [Motiliproteus sediminis]|uniref:Na/Pi cotransporter family protein n=1 Tax=Motiliproteus sediminis TaxID=1468178 RepID=UPI001FEB15F6|nr:Na/Pi symporter [Motiliproteus sediminis]
MLRKILLPVIFAVLAYGFWVSTDFKAISAGVAIFLFGMLSLEEGFRVFSGGVLERVLKRSTDKLWKSLSFGIFTTTLMQSSSLVSVITISFLSAGLLGLKEGIGIIFGANLGTTTGAWLVAGFGLKVKISAYAMPMLVFGTILLFQKAKHLKGIGYILSGLGFLFLGIHYMKEGFDAFKDNFDLAAYAVSGYAGLFLFSLIGTLATVVMQSSHATLVLIITALSTGQITYENALALAIGANIGTTITAIIGALGSNAPGRRLAGAHLVFNVATGMVAIVFINQLIRAVDQVSLWAGIADLDFTLKLAVFHTLFNLLGVVLMLPLINPLVRLLERTFKEPAEVKEGPRYIVASAVEFPDTAVEAVRNETLHVYDNAREIICLGLGMRSERVLNDPKFESELARQSAIPRVDMDRLYEQRVKTVFSAIIAFISEASFTWKERQSGDLHWLRDANRNIVEAVKAAKHTQKNMLRYLLSDNHHIRKEYNQLRLSVAHLLQQLEQLRTSSDEETTILSLDELKLAQKEREQKLNQRLYQLIRDNSITPAMGGSLMNDAAYISEIHTTLLNMAATLFTHRRRDLAGAERQIALDPGELERVLEQQQAAAREEKA